MKGTRKKEVDKQGGGGTSCKSTRVSGVFRRCRFLYLSLLFLSLARSAFADEDNNDFSGVISHIRSRRSTEHISPSQEDLSLIPSNYSMHEPPPTNNSEATKVKIFNIIWNIHDINELNEELTLEVSLTISWKDARLSHLADRKVNKLVALNPVVLNYLWHPDILIEPLKNAAQPALFSRSAIDSNPGELHIYPDNTIRYSSRILVTVSCQMKFYYYPADTQRCNVVYNSFAYSHKVLALDWSGTGVVLHHNLELPNFDVALDATEKFIALHSSGYFFTATLRFTILLRRKLSYHLIQTYLPSTLFIIISWLSFLLPLENLSDRLALCMTTLLTLTAMFGAVRQNTPNVSYVKALDYWMVVCIFFVFLILVESTVLFKLKNWKTNLKSVPPPLQQPPPSTRWSFSSLKNISDNLKFRGCKTADGIISKEATIIEMHHEENDESNANDYPINIPRSLLAPPSAHPTPPMLLSPQCSPMEPGERPLSKYELAANKIEKFTSALIPTLFVIFQIIYWPWLINSSEYYHLDTLLKST